MRTSSVPGQVSLGVRHEHQQSASFSRGSQNALVLEGSAKNRALKGLAGDEHVNRAQADRKADKSMASQGERALMNDLGLLFEAVHKGLGELLGFMRRMLSPTSTPSSVSQHSAVNEDKAEPAKAAPYKPDSEAMPAKRVDDLTIRRPVIPSTEIGRGSIWSGFRQGPDGNCVTVSAIKAAMMRFGTKPADTYKEVKPDGNGYHIEMRDGFKLYLSKAEFREAEKASEFRGDDRSLLDEANFLYAVSAKRAQLKNNDGYARQSFAAALRSLNDGEDGREGLERLGLIDHIVETTAGVLAAGQLGVVTHGIRTRDGVIGHSLAVIGGREEVWGRQGPPPPPESNALALV